MILFSVVAAVEGTEIINEGNIMNRICMIMNVDIDYQHQ